MSFAHLLVSYGILSAKLKSTLRDQPGLANTQNNQITEMIKNTSNGVCILLHHSGCNIMIFNRLECKSKSQRNKHIIRRFVIFTQNSKTQCWPSCETIQHITNKSNWNVYFLIKILIKITQTKLSVLVMTGMSQVTANM